MPPKPEPRGMSEAQSERTKEREGFKAEPYADGKTGHSIGYGFHKSAWPDKAMDVQTPITREQADELFQYVDNWNTNYMAEKFGADNWNSLDQRHVDALLSVAYNAGAPGLWKKVGRDLKEGNFERVAETLETYATTGYQRGKKVDLCPRRKEDADLFRAGSRQIQMGVGGSVGVEVSYSSDKGWSWWPSIGFALRSL
jgi:GH24 family phage-related lysozyme (muramidase)